MGPLSFLGNGAAFNFNSNNNCAYFIDKNCLYLIDCGEKIFNHILEKNLLKNIEKVYVLITHLHSDHIGSLEPMMYYMHYFTNIETHVYYPKSSRLKKLLILTGLTFPFEIESPISNKIGDFTFEPVIQKHIYGSYGYFVYGKYNFFYSGDTSIINKRAIKELKSNKIDCIYHEVTINPNAMIHTTLNDLCSSFNPELRKRVICMHFSSQETINACIKNGFSIAKEI